MTVRAIVLQASDASGDGVTLHPIGRTVHGATSIAAGELTIDPTHISAVGPEGVMIPSGPGGQCLAFTATRLLINGASVLVYERPDEVQALLRGEDGQAIVARLRNLRDYLWGIPGASLT